LSSEIHIATPAAPCMPGPVAGTNATDSSFWVITPSHFLRHRPDRRRPRKPEQVGRVQESPYGLEDLVKRIPVGLVLGWRGTSYGRVRTRVGGDETKFVAEIIGFAKDEGFRESRA